MILIESFEIDYTMAFWWAGSLGCMESHILVELHGLSTEVSA